MQKDNLISIVIPTYNRQDKLCRLLDSIKASNRSRYVFEVIVIDDASPHDFTSTLAQNYPWVNLIRNPSELYLAESRNSGIRASHGKYIFLVDDDNVLDKDCIVSLADFMDKCDLGMTVPYMCYLSKKAVLWCAGTKISKRLFTSFLLGNTPLKEAPVQQQCDTAPNAFMLSRQAIEEVGFFDTKNFPTHHLEADYGIRLRRAGFTAMATKRAITYHDIAYEAHFDSDMRHKRRPYNIMVGEVMLQRKWEKGAWKYAIPLVILADNFYIILNNSHIQLRDKPSFMKAALRGYMDGWARRLQ